MLRPDKAKQKVADMIGFDGECVSPLARLAGGARFAHVLVIIASM
jgi:hypothetical protein